MRIAIGLWLASLAFAVVAPSETPSAGGDKSQPLEPEKLGRGLFRQKCGTCHSFTANKQDKFESLTGGNKASDLGDFASKEWILGLLRDPMNDKYFGLVKAPELDDESRPLKDDKGNVVMKHALTMMQQWRRGIDGVREEKKLTKEQGAVQEREFEDIAAWLADMRKPKDHPDKAKQRSDELADKGIKAFFTKANKCATCHAVEVKDVGDDGKVAWVKAGGDSAPDLIDYGSAPWIRSMIMRPGHRTRFGAKNRMPAFRHFEGPGSEIALEEFLETNPGTKLADIRPLTDIERELIIRWMLRDYRPIYGGAPIK